METVLSSTSQAGGIAKIIKRTRRKKYENQANADIVRVLQEESWRSGWVDTIASFLTHANEFWCEHTKVLGDQDEDIDDLLRGLVIEDLSHVHRLWNTSEKAAIVVGNGNQSPCRFPLIS